MNLGKIDGFQMLDILAQASTSVFRLASGKVLVIQADVYDRQTADALGKALCAKANEPLVKLQDVPRMNGVKLVN